MASVFDDPKVASALDLYIDWLNSWFEKDDWADGPVPEVTRHDFEANGTKVLGRIQGPWYEYVHIIADFGDDGGPAVLTGCYRESDFPRYLIQEFDTMVQFIRDEGKVVNLPS